MQVFLLDISKNTIGIVLALFAKDVYEGVKEWWRKRKINPMEVAVDRLRKEAKWENETYGANWHIPFDADD